MSPETHKPLDSYPLSGIASTARYRRCLITALAACAITACSDDESAPPAPKGWGCVSVLDQKDERMTGCTFDYEAPPEGEANDNCLEGQLFVFGDTKKYRINAECITEEYGKLAGYVDMPIAANENDPHESHLVNSLCYSDDNRIILDPLHKKADLSESMGRSTDTSCAHWFTETDTRKTEISALTLQCETFIPNCDPEDGRDYLRIMGENGTYSGGKPIHLTVEAATDLVPAGKEVTVWATIREIFGAEQEIKRPVIVRGPEANPADGGAGGAGGTGGADGGSRG